MKDLKADTRNISMDLLRILACILVVCYHARGMKTEHTSTAIVHTIDSITVFAAFFFGRLGVPLFLLISGYFSFPKDLETFTFLRKRLSRIVPPFLFWLLLTTLIVGGTKEFGHNLCTLKCAGHLWYIYTLIGLLFIIPLVNPFLQQASKKEIVLYLAIWGLTLVFNGNYFESLLVYKLDNYGMSSSNIFHAFIAFYGYFGYYFLLGFVASKHKFHIHTPFALIVLAVVLWLGSAFICKIEIHAAWFYLSLPVVMMSFAVFILFNRFKIGQSNVKWEGAIVKISNLTFGVYLVHGLVLHLMKQMSLIHFTNNLFTGLLAFTVSYIIVWSISFLPFKKWLIG